MPKYDHKKIENKWQKKWDKEELYKAQDFSDKQKFYCLIEFPYPSGEGLHVGHPRSYTALDILARKRRMQGQNVLFPIGWDAFGLPAENYAIKTGTHPKVTTEQNIANYTRQLKSLGFSFDWSREISTMDPKYYKWTQWIFLKLFEKGLAYKTKIDINWCVSCNAGLANEEVVNGKCERCGGEVIRKEREQWMLKITAYAERLIKDLDMVNYLEKIKKQQIDWIGRSEGADIDFRLKNLDLGFKVYTTRPDTLFGCTFCVLSPEHQLISDLGSQITNLKEVEDYQEQAKKKSELERTELQKEKTGVELKGVKAINPVNGKEMPIFIADYVLPTYGYGAIMAVPAHDDRDWEFAIKYNLPIIPVIKSQIGQYTIIEKSLPDGGKELEKYGSVVVEKTDKNWGKFFKVSVDEKKESEFIKYLENNLLKESDDGGAWYADSMGTTNVAVFSGKSFNIFTTEDLESFKKYGRSVGIPEDQLDIEFKSFTGDGIMVNSEFLNGLNVKESIAKMTDWLEKKKCGKKAINYKLRDWVFSRQRYWGEPIPIVNCPKCGYVPIPEKDLPVELPEVKNYRTSDTGDSPLSLIDKWVNVKCPKCGGPAKRETDTMPQWAGSSWYFLRYIDSQNDKALADFEKLKYWTPVDWYNGGMEHTTLHLLYSRFWHKFLYDIGAVPTPEPYAKRTSHGLILGENGEKMSKSRGNVVNPDDVVGEYGADTFRVYEMFMGPFDQPTPWSTQGVLGVRRFVERVWQIGQDLSKNKAVENIEGKKLLNKTIQQIEKQIETLDLNTCVSSMMMLVNNFSKNGCDRQSYEKFLIILSAFAPFICEEIWCDVLGNKFSVTQQFWPKVDETLIQEEEFEIIVQVNGKVRDKIKIPSDISQEEVKKLVFASEKIKQWVEGKEIVKEVYVAGKLYSIAVK